MQTKFFLPFQIQAIDYFGKQVELMTDLSHAFFKLWLPGGRNMAEFVEKYHHIYKVMK